MLVELRRRPLDLVVGRPRAVVGRLDVGLHPRGALDEARGLVELLLEPKRVLLERQRLVSRRL